MPYYAGSSSSASSSGRSSLDNVRSKEKTIVVHNPRSDKSKSKDKSAVIIDRGEVCKDNIRRNKNNDGDYYR